MILIFRKIHLILLLSILSTKGFASTLKILIDETNPSSIYDQCSKNPEEFKKTLYLDSYFHSLKYTFELMQLSLSGKVNQVANSLSQNNGKSPLLYHFLSNPIIQEQIKNCLDKRYVPFKAFLIAQDYSGKAMGILLTFYLLRGIGKASSFLLGKVFHPISKLFPVLQNPKVQKILNIFGFSVFFWQMAKEALNTFKEFKEDSREDEMHLKENEEKSLETANLMIQNFKEIINNLNDDEVRHTLIFKDAVNNLKTMLLEKQNREPTNEEIKLVCLASHIENNCEDVNFLRQLIEAEPLQSSSAL